MNILYFFYSFSMELQSHFTGDFNGDGRSDIALITPVGYLDKIPVAFAQGDGSACNVKFFPFTFWQSCARRFQRGWCQRYSLGMDLPLGIASIWSMYPLWLWILLTDLKVITGDFNGDHNNRDISIFAKNAQGGDWMTAYSAGNGSWRIGKKHTRKHFDDWSFTSGGWCFWTSIS